MRGKREKVIKYKILLVDDNEQDRKIIQRFLNKAGFEELLFAENGEEGLKMAESVRPDLVILDTLLPEIDGFEVCRQIREHQKETIPKIIIVTGSVDAVDAIKARKAGADDYCAKTSDYSALIEAVKKLLRG